MPHDASAPEPGRIGKYRLLQRLGEGGMGVVHLALDPSGKAVAVKVLRQHIAADPDARRRLAREVSTLRRVRHPRIASVIDADVECDVPYLVTSFVPGKPLDAHVRDHGPLPRGHVARVGAVLAEALAAIHDLGIVHRDVKPANVMLLDGEPILIDFGIAHVTDESRITHTGLVMGTPGYLSPEIIGGEPVTAATDWWGWGATLAFAATGRPPFGTGPIEVVLDRVRRGQSDVSGVDDGLRATLTAALTVDPARRPSPARLVAGLAAAAPQRNGIRSVAPPVPAVLVDLSDDERPTERTPPPPREANRVRAAVAAAPMAAPAGPPRLVSAADAVTAVTPPPSAAAEARTARVPPPPFEARTTVVPPPPFEARTAAVPPPPVEARTTVVPPPPAWGEPDLPQTRRFDSPNRFAGPAGPDGDPGAAQGGPANGFAGPRTAYGQSAGAPPAPVQAPGRPAQGPPQAPQPAGSGPAPWGPSGAGGAAEPAEPAVRKPVDPGKGVLLGVMAVLAAVAAVAPYGAIWLAVIGMVVARVVDRSTTALLVRRDQRGPRGSDGLVTTVALPWRLLRALLTTGFALILPVLLGISAAFIAATAWAGTAAKTVPGQPGPLAVGMVTLLLTAWWGPGGGSVRRGATKTVRFACPGPRARIAVWVVLVLAFLSALSVMHTGNSPDWGPLDSSKIVEQLSLN